MSAVLRLKSLPQKRPFVFTEKSIIKNLYSLNNCFIYSVSANKIYGPFKIVQDKKKIILKGSWRRGVPVTDNFYISLNKKIVNLSTVQEKCLLFDLEKINKPVPVSDLFQISLKERKLLCSFTTHNPFISYINEFNIDLKRIKSLSFEIKKELIFIRNFGIKSSLIVLSEKGRKLLKTLIPDTELINLLKSTASRPLLITFDSNLSFCTFEFIYPEEFLFLDRPVSRTIQIYNSIKPDKDELNSLKNYQIIFISGKYKPDENLNRLFNICHSMNISYQNYTIPFKNLLNIMAQAEAVHFSGHGIINQKRFFWQSTDRLLKFNPVCELMPSFIFSNTCNRDFFSSFFSKTAQEMITNGLKSWVGAWADIDLNNYEFAEIFYTNFFKGIPVAESVLETRLSLLNKNSPNAFLFGLFGDPLKKFLIK